MINTSVMANFMTPASGNMFEMGRMSGPFAGANSAVRQGLADWKTQQTAATEQQSKLAQIDATGEVAYKKAQLLADYKTQQEDEGLPDAATQARLADMIANPDKHVKYVGRVPTIPRGVYNKNKKLVAVEYRDARATSPMDFGGSDGAPEDDQPIDEQWMRNMLEQASSQ